MLTKLPGHLFTGYETAQFFAENIINEQQYLVLIEDFLNSNELRRESYQTLIKTYDFTNDLPKSKVFVKLSEDITDERRDFLANGIRSFFRNDAVILIDLVMTVRAIESSLVLFQIFVSIVGTIALILAFFLLLISTT